MQEVLDFEPTQHIVGGDPSTWALETTPEIIILPVKPDPVIDTKPLPLYDCETPHPPVGDCSILYAECAFKGCF